MIRTFFCFAKLHMVCFFLAQLMLCLSGRFFERLFACNGLFCVFCNFCCFSIYYTIYVFLLLVYFCVVTFNWCCVFCFRCCFFFVRLGRYRSTSPPGGNQVDGLPPALRRFCSFGVFKLEFLEIGEFVWSNRNFPIVFSHVAFDSWCHIAKQMRNAGAWYGQASVSWNRKF